MATLQEQIELNKLLAKEVEYRSKIEELKGESITNAEKLARQAKERANNLSETLDLLQMDSQARRDQIDALKDLIDREKQRGQISAALAAQRIKALDEIRSLTDAEAKSLEAVYEQNVANATIELERLGLIIDGVNAMDQMAENLSRAVGFGGSLTKNILDAIDAGASMGDIFEKAGKTLKKNFSPTGFLAFAIRNTAQLLKEFDETVASLAATTGTGREFAGVVEEAFKNTSNFATTLKDTAQAADELYGSFVLFGTASRATQTSLVESATLLDRFGISTAETGQRLNFLTMVLGKSIEEADKFNEGLVRLSIGLKMPADIISKQYTELIPKLALFRDGGTKAFEDTAIAARQMGLDIKTGTQELFALSEGLQDFESAAEKAASINVVLGGSFVNAFDLVMGAAEGPVEQIKQLQNAFQAAGKDIDNMGFYERKFLADSLGVSFDTLTKIMNGQIDTNEEVKTTEEEMRDALKATADTMSLLNSTLQSLTFALEPLLNILRPVVEFLGVFFRLGGDIIVTTIALGKAVILAAEAMLVFGVNSALAVGIFGAIGVGAYAGYLFVKKFGDYLGSEGLGIIAMLLGIGAALQFAQGNLFMGFLLGTAAAAVGLGALGVIGGEQAAEKEKTTGLSVGSFSDFKAGSSVNDAIIQSGKITPINSQDEAMTVLARPGGAIDLTAQSSQRQTGNDELKPAIEQMMKMVSQFMSSATQVMTRPQAPVEVALNLDGKKLTKKVVSNINRDFSLTNEARMPTEGLG
ncbi:MAG: hypothetical protein ACXADH_01725 [Candidatus Kariarchaeaceae archaeon]